MRGTTTAVLAAAVTVAAVTLAGCQVPPPDGYEGGAGADTVDCDSEDLRGYERDCGYWAPNGTFVTWYWVSGTGTSYAPYGWSPRLPSRGSWTRPAGKAGKARTSRQAAPAPVTTTRKATPRTTPKRQAPKVTPKPSAPKPRGRR